MTAIREFITHYHLPDRRRFLNRDAAEGRIRLEELIGRYGLPRGERPESYDGHRHDDFEHYIELRLWSDPPIP